MNFIKNIFCRKIKNDGTDEVFQDTQDTDNDRRFKSDLEQINEESENNTPLNGLQYKRIALHALKKKKRYEKQLRDIDNTLSTLAIQRDELQNSQVETNVMVALNASLSTLEDIIKNINIEMEDQSELEQQLEELGEKELSKLPDTTKPIEDLATSVNSSDLEEIEINS